MAPASLRRAFGAVKDHTAISLAKVTTASSTISDLEIAIVKATRHDDRPADERHVKEILSLTCYSRHLVAACVDTLSRRLGRTGSWAVALKTLGLVHRLLVEGDPAYEQEVMFATRRGTRMLNMSDFRDSTGSWDMSAMVRTVAMYLEGRMEYMMRGKGHRRRRTRRMCDEEENEEEQGRGTNDGGNGDGGKNGSKDTCLVGTPVREMKTETVFVRTMHLQHLLDRFLACRPTGEARNQRIVVVVLYPIVKESFQLYHDLTDSMAVLVDRFSELDVPDCVRVYNTFTRLSKQFDDLISFYAWSKSAGIARSGDYPEIHRITQAKLDVMDEFIRDKAGVDNHISPDPSSPVDDGPRESVLAVKALPAPESMEVPVQEKEYEENKEIIQEKAKVVDFKEEDEVDFLNLKEDATVAGTTRESELVLALFDGDGSNSIVGSAHWEAFAEGKSDWETALVEVPSVLQAQKASLGGGLDVLTLEGMYHSQQPTGQYTGSASSVAGRGQVVLALPGPEVGGADPFAGSEMVAAPAYVQMKEMERKRELMAQEQAMWEMYRRNGMQQRGGYQVMGGGGGYLYQERQTQ